MENHTGAIAAHYARDNLIQNILDALQADGIDLSTLSPDELQLVDEIHTRGRQTTEEVVALTSFAAEHHVVDLGSGVGGPARHIAGRFGCQVTGIDLTESFVTAANRLSDLVGLADRTRFHTGSALSTPFDDAIFDRALTIQMQMGIADKAALYAEIFRILKPGAAFVFQDIVAGPTAGPIHTPTPWASVPDQSFLARPDELRRLIEAAGFACELWRETTDEMKAWQTRQSARAKGSQTEAPRPALDIQLVLGPTAGEKRRNSQRNLLEDRIGYVQAVFRKS